jgi:hypothetical protein
MDQLLRKFISDGATHAIPTQMVRPMRLHLLNLSEEPLGAVSGRRAQQARQTLWLRPRLKRCLSCTFLVHS